MILKTALKQYQQRRQKSAFSEANNSCLSSPPRSRRRVSYLNSKSIKSDKKEEKERRAQQTRERKWSKGVPKILGRKKAPHRSPAPTPKTGPVLLANLFVKNKTRSAIKRCLEQRPDWPSCLFWQYFKHFVAEIESKPNLSFAVNQSKLSLRCLNFAKKSSRTTVGSAVRLTDSGSKGSPVLSPATQIRFVVNCRKGNVNSIYFWRLVLQTKPTDKQKAFPPPTFKSEAKKSWVSFKILKRVRNGDQVTIIDCFLLLNKRVHSVLFAALLIHCKCSSFQKLPLLHQLWQQHNSIVWCCCCSSSRANFVA